MTKKLSISDCVAIALKGAGQPVETENVTRAVFSGGGQRESSDSKPRFDLLYPRNQPHELQLLTRFAEWMRRGAEKYAARHALYAAVRDGGARDPMSRKGIV